MVPSIACVASSKGRALKVRLHLLLLVVVLTGLSVRVELALRATLWSKSILAKWGGICGHVVAKTISGIEDANR